MTERGRLAVVGTGDCVLAFTAIGIESITAEDEGTAKEALRRLIRENYAVILITDDVAAKIADTLETLKSRPYPVVIPIPSPATGGSYGMESIRKDVERALGADILFREDG